MRKRLFKSLALVVTMMLLTSVLSGCQLLQKEPSLERAEDLLDDGDIDEAIDMLEDLIDEDEEEHDLWVALVEAYIEDEEFEDAADVMEDWAEIIEEMYEDDPEDVEDSIDDYEDLKEEIEEEDEDILVYQLELVAPDATSEMPTEEDTREDPVGIGIEAIMFTDENLLNAILDANYFGNYDPAIGITPEMALEVEWLDLSYSDITSLEGIQYFSNLVSLDLQDNSIEDISQLSSLTKLVELTLWNNDVSDLGPLGDMVDLVYLDLENNQVRDISALSRLTNLEVLYLDDNPVEDLSPLENLANLYDFDLQQTEGDEAGPAPVNDPVELVLYDHVSTDEIDMLDELIDEFEDLYDYITITRSHYSYEDFETIMSASITSGTGPSIAYVHSDFVGKVYQNFLQPVENVVDYSILSRIEENILNGGYIDFEYYFAPLVAGDHLALLFDYDHTTAPYSWDDLIQIAWNNIDSGKQGLLFPVEEPYWFLGFYNGFGGHVLNSDRTPNLNTNEMVEALEFYRELYQSIGTANMDYNTMNSGFISGDASYIINGTWSWQSYFDNVGSNVSVMTPPVLPSGNPPRFYHNSTGFIVPNTVTNEDELRAVGLFIEFMLRTENNARMAVASHQAPATLAARDEDIVFYDPIAFASSITISDTLAIPAIPEMSGIWNAISPELAAVLYDNKDPWAAAADMQEAAETYIADIQSSN